MKLLFLIFAAFAIFEIAYHQYLRIKNIRLDYNKWNAIRASVFGGLFLVGYFVKGMAPYLIVFCLLQMWAYYLFPFSYIINIINRERNKHAIEKDSYYMQYRHKWGWLFYLSKRPVTDRVKHWLTTKLGIGARLFLEFFIFCILSMWLWNYLAGWDAWAEWLLPAINGTGKF